MVLVPNKAVFQQALSIAGKNPKAVVHCLCYEFMPKEKCLPKNVVLSQERDFPDILSLQEIRNVYSEAVAFSRIWFKHDAAFEKGISYRGISFGVVSEHQFFYAFKGILLLLKTAVKLALGEGEATIVGPKAGFVGECARIAAEKSGAELKLLDFGAEKAVDRWQNFNLRKLLEFEKKARRAVGKGFSSGRGRTVFFRGRDYLGSLLEEMEKDTSFGTFSLDDFLVRELLNPFAFLRFLKTRSKKRAFFRGLYGKYKLNRGFRESLVFEGMDFSSAFILRVLRFTERDWPEFVFLVDILLKEFEKRKPALIVVWEDVVPFERISVLVARQFGIKSLVLQHGLLKPLTPKGDWIIGYAPLTANKIAVWSDLAKSHLVSHGVSGARVVATGSPKFDATHNRSFNPEKFRKSQGIGLQEKLVVFAAEGLMFDTDTIGNLIDWVEVAFPDVKARFVVKVRKIEDPKRWQARLGGKAMVLRDVDLYELLNACDVVVGKVSSVGLEGMVFGKPFVVFEEEGRKDFRGSYDSDAVLRASNKSEFVKAFALALDDRQRPALEEKIAAFVERIAFRQDGKATARVISLIKEMMGRVVCSDLKRGGK